MMMRQPIGRRSVWCQDNNLSLNVSKTKELIMHYRKWRTEHTAIDIGTTLVEWKFLGGHITKDLSWSTHTNTVFTTPLEAENIWYWASDPEKVPQLHH